MSERPAHRRSHARLLPALLILLTLIVFGGLWYLGDRADTAEVQRDDASATAQDLAEQVAEVCARDPAAATAARLQCSRAERVAAQGPPGDPGPPGLPGERGPAPTPAEIEAAVADYCSDGRCSLPPSQDLVLAAVTQYCAAGNCLGPAGEDGADSTVAGPEGPSGPAGPGPTAEQIAAAVESYCSSGACAGPPGPEGAPGDDGSPPAGWTWTDPLTRVTYTCTRDMGSPDDSPTYTCTAN